MTHKEYAAFVQKYWNFTPPGFESYSLYMYSAWSASGTYHHHCLNAPTPDAVENFILSVLGPGSCVSRVRKVSSYNAYYRSVSNFYTDFYETMSPSDDSERPESSLREMSDLPVETP